MERWPRLTTAFRKPPAQQRGVVMIVALLVLVIMSLATLAMVRSVNTGSLIAGNLSFRQDAVSNSDRVIQEAISVIHNNLSADLGSLNNDLSGGGYYASEPAKLDATGNSRADDNLRILIDWDNNQCGAYATNSYAGCTLKPKTSAATLTDGNSAAYIVFRMCQSAGAFDASTTGCATTTATASISCQGSINYENEGRCASGTSVTPFYRVLVRVSGPRNTTSHTETIVHF